MKPLACIINYGKMEINYKLLIMDRKSLEIAVHPDKSVVVKAPMTSNLEAIEERVKKRARWIKKQINFFKQFEPRTPKRQYVGGESHLYLGRKYRLKIEESKCDKVLLKNGYFYIECKKLEPSHIKNLLDKWYREKGAYLTKEFNNCWENFNKGSFGKPNLKLQNMKRRWGSLSKSGQLTLNLKLIQAPKECIEYVIIHELCHLVHHNHSSDFYKLLDRTMPDWIKRKHKLEMSLA